MFEFHTNAHHLTNKDEILCDSYVYLRRSDDGFIAYFCCVYLSKMNNKINTISQ